MTKFAALLRWQVICMVTMAAGAFLIFARVATADTWFENLNKPLWTPPVEFFVPVWMGLFLLLGVAVWLVSLQHEEPVARLGVKFFFVLLAMSIIWVAVFFGVKDPAAGAIEIVILWLVVLATLSLFWQRSRLAGYLLFPYLVWATFASYLNIMIWQLNA